jgi:4-cresol dehydrogenase (hydroxylating)
MTDCIAQIKAVINEQALLLTEAKDIQRFRCGTEGLSPQKNKHCDIICVVKPHSRSDVQSILKLANTLSSQSELRFTIHPISTGLNWGYGTGQPPLSNNRVVILDMSALKNIDFDQELGLITLEPGVTQQKLSDYLKNIGDQFMVPVTGAGPDCSLVGNAIERGYGITPYTDHFGAVTAFKGFWGSGLEYCSAINALDQTDDKTVDKTFKWGLGPYLDGLFTQSNFGIVTSMTIRLARKPKKFISFIIQVPSDSELEKAIPLIRKVLRDYEGIVGSINLMDKRRVLSMFADNPTPGEHKVMSDAAIERLSKEQQTPSWTIMGSIYGTKGISTTAKREIKKIFSKINCRQMYSNSIIFPLGNSAISLSPDFLINSISFIALIKKQLASFELGKEIMLGKPNKMALKLAYWRHKNAKDFKAEDMSPAKDGCGLLWYAPLIVMKPEKMRQYVEFIRATCPKHNIEPLITFTNLKHDCVDSTIPIIFDLSNPVAVQDAHNCLKELVTEGLKLGFVPYRLNIDQQQCLLDAQAPFWQTVNKIKAAVDPADILSLGRYNPRSE